MCVLALWHAAMRHACMHGLGPFLSRALLLCCCVITASSGGGSGGGDGGRWACLLRRGGSAVCVLVFGVCVSDLILLDSPSSTFSFPAVASPPATAPCVYGMHGMHVCMACKYVTTYGMYACMVWGSSSASPPATAADKPAQKGGCNSVCKWASAWVQF